MIQDSQKAPGGIRRQPIIIGVRRWPRGTRRLHAVVGGGYHRKWHQVASNGVRLSQAMSGGTRLFQEAADYHRKWPGDTRRYQKLEEADHVELSI